MFRITNSQLLNFEVSSFQLKDGTGVFVITSVPNILVSYFSLPKHLPFMNVGSPKPRILGNRMLSLMLSTPVANRTKVVQIKDQNQQEEL
jgi:hypothetical protein